MAPRQKKVAMKSAVFKQRFPGFKKKATELSILCGNSVGFICYGPDNNDLHVWPENPQALQQLSAKFNGQSDLNKKKHACDLNDYPNLKDFSAEELKSHLSILESHLAGIKRKKLEILIKGPSSSSSSSASSDQRVSSQNHATTSDRRELETNLNDTMSEDHLEIPYQKIGSKNVSDFDLQTLVVPEDADPWGMMEDLGFGEEYYPTPINHNLPTEVWDLDFALPFSSYDNSFLTNTCQTPTTNYCNSFQGFDYQPLV